MNYLFNSTKVKFWHPLFEKINRAKAKLIQGHGYYLLVPGNTFHCFEVALFPMGPICSFVCSILSFSVWRAFKTKTTNPSIEAFFDLMSRTAQRRKNRPNPKERKLETEKKTWKFLKTKFGQADWKNKEKCKDSKVSLEKPDWFWGSLDGFESIFYMKKDMPRKN